MKGPLSKYLFFGSSGLILILMLLTCRDAGITCDEVLHYNHSLCVYSYFATKGHDQSALNTPVTQLKYYGQSYDNLVTILTKWFHIEDIYGFRHIMSSLAGWLAIMITAIFAAWLTGYRTGIIVILLFAVSPTFLGHSQNNLKDVPFALGYISGIYFILKFSASGRKVTFRDAIALIACIAFSISIRAGGLILICYLIFFCFLYFLLEFLKSRQADFREIRNRLLWIICITAVSWGLSIILWPYALQSPVRNVLESYRVMAHFPSTFRQIFEGKMEWSDFMPWYYLIKSMAITIPLVVIAGFFMFFVFIKKTGSNGNSIKYFLILFTIIFPVVFVVCEKSNLYSSWRQFLFLYPVIVLIAATGFNFLLDYLVKVKYSVLGIAVFMALLSAS